MIDYKETIKNRNEYWEQSRKEVMRVLDRFQIQPPVCGFHIGTGWIPIVEKAFEKMISSGWNKDLQQVKQKFCGLCIYIGNSTPEIFEHIKTAMIEAKKACERCGEPHGLEIPKTGQALCLDCNKILF